MVTFDPYSTAETISKAQHSRDLAGTAQQRQFSCHYLLTEISVAVQCSAVQCSGEGRRRLRGAVCRCGRRRQDGFPAPPPPAAEATQLTASWPAGPAVSRWPAGPAVLPALPLLAEPEGRPQGAGGGSGPGACLPSLSVYTGRKGREGKSVMAWWQHILHGTVRQRF
jgi:hypothetical protein